MITRSTLGVLLLATVFTTALPQSASTASLTNFPNLVIFDSTNKKVGQPSFLSTSSDVRLDFRFGQFSFYVYVKPSGFYTSGERYLYFQDGTCSSIPFLDAFVYNYSQEFLTPAVVNQPGHTVYIANPATPPQNRTIGSLRFADGTCCAGSPIFDSCFGEATTYFAVEALPVINLDTKFTPPFTTK